jgi:molecular chaperone DnaK
LHADEDKRKLEIINARNEADNTVFQIEKQLKEHGSKLSDSTKTVVQGAIDRVKESCKGEDAQEMKQATSDLITASQELAKHMSGGPGDAGQPGAAPGQGAAPGGKGGDDVIDAEFEVKK